MIISGHQDLDFPASELAEDVDLGLEVELRNATVPIQSHGSRVDRTLAEAVPEFSRSYLQQLILAGAVRHNGVAVVKASGKVKAGDSLSVELRPTPQSVAFKPEAMSLEVVFEDEFLMILNKPAGLVVHPAPGNWSGTLLNGLLARDAQASMLPRAGIVHRLDKGTSGLMIVARTRQTMDQLISMIAQRAVSRQYLAIGHAPWVGSKNRTVNLPVGRDPRNRLRMAAVDLDKSPGKSATTDFLLLENGSKHCLVRCSLHTGRTHQIRVHMATMAHPLVADLLYGGRPDACLDRQALHAYRLAFVHPVTQKNLAFYSELPADLLKTIEQLGLGYNESSKSTVLVDQLPSS